MARLSEFAPSLRYLALLKLTYRLAEEDRLIKSNPTRTVKQSKENGRIRYLSDAEEERLHAAIQKSFPERLPEFEVGLMTGMRQGEQFTREWNDIDLDAGTIRLPQTKNGECRFVQLNSKGSCIAANASRPKHRFWARVLQSSSPMVH